MKAGAVNKALVAASKLIEAGYDVVLTGRPRLFHRKPNKTIPLVKKGGMFILNM